MVELCVPSDASTPQRVIMMMIWNQLTVAVTAATSAEPHVLLPYLGLWKVVPVMNAMEDRAPAVVDQVLAAGEHFPPVVDTLVWLGGPFSSYSAKTRRCDNDSTARI